MPNYEYHCPSCGKKFEVTRAMKDVKGEEPCPDCNISSPRVFSTFQFTFSPYLQELREGNMVDY